METLLLPLALFAVMYVFLIMPQRKKQRAQQDLLGTIGPGDEVVTGGGIYGGVTEVDGEVVYLEIAPDIEIKVARRAIADRVYRATAPGAGAKNSSTGTPGAADSTTRPTSMLGRLSRPGRSEKAAAPQDDVIDVESSEDRSTAEKNQN